MCPAAPRICPRRGAVSHSRAVEHRPGGSGSCQGSEPRLQLARLTAPAAGVRRLRSFPVSALRSGTGTLSLALFSSLPRNLDDVV